MKRAQRKIKQQAKKEQKKAIVWKRDNKVMMSIKDLVFKEKQVRKLTERYIGSYIIKEVMSANVVILRLLI